MKHIVDCNDNPVSLNKSTCGSQNHFCLDKSNGKKPEHTKTIKNVRNNSENPRLIDEIMALKQIKFQLLLWRSKNFTKKDLQNF